MTQPTSADDLLAALDPEQRAVALALRGPVRVLAGAGTGKTRAVTHRIAYGVATGVYDPRHVLAVTFTTRAAGEMRGRLRAMGAGGVQARTFHSAALRQVRWFWPKVYGGEPPQLIDSKIPLLAAAARRQRLDVDQARLRDLASEVEWAKVSNVRADDYPRLAPERGREVGGVDAATVARVMTSYEDIKRDQGRMDMEDVLLCAAALLSEDERVAAEVRGQYRFFTVDEYQDLSPIQSALLDLWLGGRDELCVVGDPAQTIYSFAGARADYLLDFTRRHPAAATVELYRSYRSTPQVVDTANRVLAGGGTRSVRLEAQRPTGPEVSWREAPDEVAEAEAVAERVATLRDQGVPLSEMAVLFRINAQSEAFEEALAARGLPYVVRGAARFFDRQEVKQAIALLRGEGRAADRGGEASAAGLVDQVVGVLSGTGWSREAPTGRGQTRDRWESLQALVSQAEAFARDQADEEGGATLPGFVAELDRRAHEQHAPVAEGVTLATLHAAKGLEWDAVFCCGVHEGTMPIVYAEGPTAVEEERRLLYVGLTRAREHLWVSWSLARNPGGQARRSPSRFLDGLRPASATDRTETSARGAAKRKRSRKAASCKQCQRPLTSARERNRGWCEDCPVPYDEELFESLRTWRKERAEAEQVPAYVVFSDATLEALAEVRPTSRAALHGINGIGPAKLDKYADDLLGLLG
ncbi:ATP-dependent DNA helicase UvrD2 [Nocardioides aequoreus]|uniref:ATP-dependent DNA helicase UvrD2 n=1 Tax=Nocardioides aequoreus TaxID=397278 RepID=UPI0004C3F21F|nr:ATP-dependent DNA helicase UvrD2 [Nocardioides aequoreus]